MSLFDLKLGELRDLTASDAPTPGGGSVACVGATLGLGLVIMAAEITAKGGQGDALREWLARARAKLAELSRHADRDVEVFDGYARAWALPRATDDAKAARKSAIGAAAIACTEAPLAAARDMLDALGLAVDVAARVKRGVASDVLAGADLLVGALEAVLRNVDVNLPAILDRERAAAFAVERAALAEAGRARRLEIIEISRAPLAG